MNHSKRRLIRKLIDTSLLCGLVAILTPTAGAEEGMWRPGQIPAIAQHLKAAGLEIDPSALASRDGWPTAAVVRLGGCSASFVSPEGLLITNYHCAYSSIQQNSSVERNLIEKGFLARDHRSELPASPGAVVRITTSVEDVTDRLLKGLDGVDAAERFDTIEERAKQLVAECEKDSELVCDVASFHGGLEFSLTRQTELRDIRLVYAPPAGVGRFGGELDNFMWPRHTGDFAFFRAYVDPDGRPADPSPDNRPYRPDVHLSVASEPLTPGDFIMVLGFPGSTDRYRLAAEVEDKFTWSYPHLIEAYDAWLSVLEDATRDREDAAILYAGWIAGIHNTVKFAKGMVDSFSTSELLNGKNQLETALRTWIAADAVRRETYGPAIDALTAELDRRKSDRDLEFHYHMAGRSALLLAAKHLVRNAYEGEKPDAERAEGYQERDRAALRRMLQRIDSRFDPQVDRAVSRHFFLEYHRRCTDQRRADLDRSLGLKPGEPSEQALDQALERLYSRTRLADPEHRLSLLDADLASLRTSRDPFIELAFALYREDKRLERQAESSAGALQRLRSTYMDALIAFLESRGDTVYPDANGTLRVAYGQVRGYDHAADASAAAFTTARSLLAKSTGEAPYVTPAAVAEGLRKGDFGRLAGPTADTLPINFMGTVDVTGGNSGSPTLDRRGNLVGLLFDTSYESIISDWDYIPAVSRSVHVDIRYVLWLLATVDGGENLLEEMGVERSALSRRPTLATSPPVSVDETTPVSTTTER